MSEEYTSKEATEYKSPLSPLSPVEENQRPILNLKDRFKDVASRADDEATLRKIDEAVNSGTMGELEQRMNTKSPKNPNA